MKEVYFYRGMCLNIVNNYRSLNSGNLTSFLDENEFLDLSLAITYMTLSKDLVITKDMKDKNPERRLTSSVDMEIFDYLFTKEFNEEVPIISKSTGTSKRWIVDSIRDSILHGQYEVDLDNKCFKINNGMKSRELVCTVPFSWIKRYADFHILENKKVTNINITQAFLNQDIANNFNLIHNEKELEDFTNKLILYNINIESNNEINEKKIQREIKNYIDEKNYLNVEEEFKYKSYRQKWESIKQDLTKYLQNNYPDIKISINEIENEFISKDLISLYNKGDNDIFKEKDESIQYSEIQNRINKYLSRSDEDVLNSIEKFISSRKIYEKEIKNSKDYEECKDVIFYILNSKNNGSKTLEFIHKYRIKQGLENTYDDIMIGDYHLISIDDEDKAGINKFLENKLGFKPTSLQIPLSILREYNIDIYNKYNKRFSLNDIISKEDIEFYNKKIIRVAEQLRSKTDKEKDLLELGMIYNLGINTYVMNKERVFDKIGYDDIDLKNIKAYNISANNILNNDYKVENDRIKRANEKIDEILEKNPTPSKSRTKKINKIKKEIEKFNNKIKEIEEKREECIEYNGEILAPVNKDDTARIIRNCFAHFNRISFSSYDERELLLSDETGIAKCNIDDLFYFIANDNFHLEMIHNYNRDSQNNLNMVLRAQDFIIPTYLNSDAYNEIYEKDKEQIQSKPHRRI